MRISKSDRIVIKQLFSEIFSLGDALWLFGSRVDDSKKGGDIDLYIETSETDTALLTKKRLTFLGALQRQLGEQKIDVVIRNPGSAELSVHKEALASGIQLMQNQSPLESYISVLDIHAKRLSWALNRTEALFPFTPKSLATLPPEEASFVEQIISRFCKMQDEIGSKIFPLVLELTDTKAISAIDKINSMEKLGYLNNASWWTTLRDVRNTSTHEYENDVPTLTDNTNELATHARELLKYWSELKPKLAHFVDQERSSTP